MRIGRSSTTYAILFMLGLTACAGGDDEAGAPAEGGGAAADAPAVDPAQAAVIAGTIRFEGAAPAPEPIDMSQEPQCAEKHSGGAHRQAVVVNDNNTLRNVFVYVKEGLPQQNWPRASETPVLDQNGCIYQPHVLAVRAGQEFIVRNSDPLLHNVNAKPTANRGFNIGQPTAGMESRRSFSQPEVMIPVTCEVHGWMESYIAVMNHPYYAVTGEDGSYRIENLPPGTYTIETWHEKYGTQTQSVTVAAQQTGQGDFSYSAASATAVPLGKPFDPHNHVRTAAAVSPAAHR